jgi:hypothetical protein
MTKYKSNKQYTWSPEEKFELSGRDFGLILNTLRAILNTEQAAQILLADRANSAIEGIMAEYVERGIIKEIEPKTE